MTVHLPTNACMMLKTKRVLEFNTLPDHAEQKPDDCTFLKLPLSRFGELSWAHYRIHKYNCVRATLVQACELRVDYFL